MIEQFRTRITSAPAQIGSSLQEMVRGGIFFLITRPEGTVSRNQIMSVPADIQQYFSGENAYFLCYPDNLEVFIKALGLHFLRNTRKEFSPEELCSMFDVLSRHHGDDEVFSAYLQLLRKCYEDKNEVSMGIQVVNDIRDLI